MIKDMKLFKIKCKYCEYFFEDTNFKDDLI